MNCVRSFDDRVEKAIWLRVGSMPLAAAEAEGSDKLSVLGRVN
jgi:hypothetical protein